MKHNGKIFLLTSAIALALCGGVASAFDSESKDIKSNTLLAPITPAPTPSVSTFTTVNPEATSDPVIVTKPKPSKKSAIKKPRVVKSKKSSKSTKRLIHPGSRCKPLGAYGISKTGDSYICRSGSDNVGHWRR